jgi:serine/threonine-protein kinase
VERRGAASAPPAPPPRSDAAAPEAPAYRPERASVPSIGGGPSTREELIGRTIDGKYRIQAILGMGGMGTVLAAEHVAIGRPVAIKVLHKNQLHKGRAVRRFHREARAAGSIGHPNICEVYDVGVLLDESPYLVMERLVGETLDTRLVARGRLDVGEIVDLFSQVLSGLLAAHEKGIVHRDVKPENVFITRPVGYPSVVKILDFGISMLPLSAAEDSTSGLVMGTPHYMAPEQAGGEPDLDGRVDVYSCGVMLYRALTGRLPYTARSFEALLAQVLTTEPRPARELCPDMPGAFDGILAKALAKTRHDRYPGAAAFLVDLQSLRGPAAAPGPLPSPGSTPPRRSSGPDPIPSPRAPIPDALPTERDLGGWAGDELDEGDLEEDGFGPKP